MNKIYLLLGSNMGNSQQQLLLAIKHIRKKIGPVTRSSKLYQTAAWGKKNQPDFINQVIVVQTTLFPDALMSVILEIESAMGRVRTTKNAPRIIDIDILFFNKDIIHKKNLYIPHPEIQNRRFVLTPLNELSPLFKHPVLQKNIHHLLRICKDPLNVKKF